MEQKRTSLIRRDDVIFIIDQFIKEFQASSSSLRSDLVKPLYDFFSTIIEAIRNNVIILQGEESKPVYLVGGQVFGSEEEASAYARLTRDSVTPAHVQSFSYDPADYENCVFRINYHTKEQTAGISYRYEGGFGDVLDGDYFFFDLRPDTEELISYINSGNADQLLKLAERRCRLFIRKIENNERI